MHAVASVRFVSARNDEVELAADRSVSPVSPGPTSTRPWIRSLRVRSALPVRKTAGLLRYV